MFTRYNRKWSIFIVYGKEIDFYSNEQGEKICFSVSKTTIYYYYVPIIIINGAEGTP